jgi:hypothetical protein
LTTPTGRRFVPPVSTPPRARRGSNPAGLIGLPPRDRRPPPSNTCLSLTRQHLFRSTSKRFMSHNASTRRAPKARPIEAFVEDNLRRHTRLLRKGEMFCQRPNWKRAASLPEGRPSGPHAGPTAGSGGTSGRARLEFRTLEASSDQDTCILKRISRREVVFRAGRPCRAAPARARADRSPL